MLEFPIPAGFTTGDAINEAYNDFDLCLTGGTPGGAPTLLYRYQLGNHLGSASLELDENAALISYEEYYPFGSTSFQMTDGNSEVSAKRYRYTGKERDCETGLYYHGARCYAPRLGRWTAADPAGLVDGPCLYAYVRGNPVRHIDPEGKQASNSPPVSSSPSAPPNPQNFTKYQDFVVAAQGSMTPTQLHNMWHGTYTLSQTEISSFGTDEQAFIQDIDIYIEGKIQDARQNNNTREITNYENRRASFTRELRQGASHGDALVNLANVVYNEANVQSGSAKEAVAYAWMNRVGGTFREPIGAEISHYRTVNTRWQQLKTNDRPYFIDGYIKSLSAANQRLDDSNPSKNDPTQGATHWVSAGGLPDFNPSRHGVNRYIRTIGGVIDKAFPNWARATSDPEVKRMQQLGQLEANYQEVQVPGVKPETFLFYVGVR